MSHSTMGPHRRLLCTHQPTGTVAWPPQHPKDGPSAAIYSCDHPLCVLDASQWVREHTGHLGHYKAFPAEVAA